MQSLRVSRGEIGLCSLGAVEDEDHLLLVCPAHRDIRCKFSQQLRKQLTPCSLLPELMHSANQKAIALYLVSCLDNRSVFAQVNYVIVVKWISLVRVLTLN